MQTTHYVLEALKIEGIKYIFLVPGGCIEPFVSTLAKSSELKTIVAAHEAGALFMADGYARASGLFGVAMCVCGPGILNMVTGFATAKVDQSPVLVISGQVPRPWEGRGAFQDSGAAGINDIDILSSITSIQLTISHDNLIEHHLERALKWMLHHSARGPAHLSFPLDIQKIQKEFSPFKKIQSAFYKPKFINMHACEQAWHLLNENKKIIILAGAGVVHAQASNELKQFAERFQIPVATTLAAKGVFPEDHPLSLGVFGWCGTRYANESILSEDVEVLLVLGSRLSQIDTLIWNQAFAPKKALILNDMDINHVFENFEITLPILGDCGEFLKTLLNSSKKTYQALLNSNIEREKWLKEIHKIGTRYYDLENCTANLIPIHPAQVVYQLRQIMPDDTKVVVDSGAHAFFAGHYWQSYHANEFFSSLNYMAPMGWAMGAAIGIKLAQPKNPCVVITGDGCMLMHGLEIQTAARYNLPLIIIIINNSALGNVYLKADESAKQLTLLPTHDWVRFAESMGAVGIRVEKPQQLSETFQQALALNKTVVIDIICGNYPTPTEIFDESMCAAKAKLKHE